ncbi:MAG: DUF805 domain-containing protein [Dysgonamonadaceae bacterium]|jgi:uncharacterized membrane protein YhaH (DUF805 family)|nr:DUF805 domain-containing protein [Dysgonamonadaceae bacterium]
MNWYLKVLKQYADFSGRARRTEFWMFVLFNAIIMSVLAFVMIAGLASRGGGLSGLGIFLYSIYALAMVVPSLAVVVRRLHDIGKSGWFFFIGFIPLVGPIILLVFYCTDSQAGSNQWGANPKE